MRGEGVNTDQGEFRKASNRSFGRDRDNLPGKGRYSARVTKNASNPDEVLARFMENASEAFDGYSMLKRELEELRSKFAEIELVKERLEKGYRRKIDALEKELENLKSGERTGAGDRAGSAGASERENLPSPEFLSKPLVVRSNKGEYLGVCAGNSHFALSDFVGLMRKRLAATRRVEMSWERKSGNWVLLVAASEGYTGSEQRIALVLRRVVTPNGNSVVLVVRFNIDGTDVPEHLMLNMLRRIREEFQGGKR